jgi:hypothetical protein
VRTCVVVLAAAIATTLMAGCATKTAETPISEPQAVAAQPATPPPAAKPDAPATAQPAPVAKPAAPATPQPAPAAQATPQPPAGKPAAAAAPKPAPTAAGKAVPPVATTPAPAARAPKPAAPPVAAAKPAAPSTLDLNALKEQLKATKAIGVFTKISLKNKVDDLMEQFREYYQGKSKVTLADLRRSYNLLMMKVLSLLQDEDQPLASAIVSSREAIWSLLANPTTFATLQS